MLNLSVICVYNDENVLNSCLRKSMKMQSEEMEWIFLDNQKNTYTSAAQALNVGALKASRDYLVFLHQDIVFQSPDDMKNIYQALCEHEKTVLGVAGCLIHEKDIYSNVIHGQEKMPAGTATIDGMKEVDTLDECLIACSKKVYQSLKFDEILCDGWDLYGVDFCYRAILKKFSVCVLPLALWHVSPGNPKHAFYACARRLRKKYHNQFSHMRTCCITIPVSTKWYGSCLLYLLEMKNAMKRKV